MIADAVKAGLPVVILRHARSETLQNLGGQPRFADAGFAGKERHLAFAALCSRPAAQQQFGFFLPPDERGQAGRVQRLEAAFDGTRSQRCPGPHRSGDAFEVFGPEVIQLEDIADQPSRALVDDHHIRLGDRLQARRQIGGLTDDAGFRRSAIRLLHPQLQARHRPVIDGGEPTRFRTTARRRRYTLIDRLPLGDAPEAQAQR